MKATGIILAGGQSSRMGTNKALMKIGNLTVIERIIAEIQSIVDDIIIVTNFKKDYEFLNLPLAEDVWKGAGPLAGIHAGLTHSQNERNLVIACDMPFVSANLGDCLLYELKNYEVVVPQVEDQLHPLFAAYKKGILPNIEQAILDKNLKIRNVLKRVNTKILTEKEFNIEKISLYNMNYPEEYIEAKKLDTNQ